MFVVKVLVVVVVVVGWPQKGFGSLTTATGAERSQVRITQRAASV